MWPFAKKSRASLPRVPIEESDYRWMIPGECRDVDTLSEDEIAECVRLYSEGNLSEDIKRSLSPPWGIYRVMGEFVAKFMLGSRTPGLKFTEDLIFIRRAYTNYKSITPLPTEIEERERMYSDVCATTSEQVCI